VVLLQFCFVFGLLLHHRRRSTVFVCFFKEVQHLQIGQEVYGGLAFKR